jgi:hypothetical protein
MAHSNETPARFGGASGRVLQHPFGLTLNLKAYDYDYRNI